MIVDNLRKGEKFRMKTVGRFSEEDVHIFVKTCRCSYGFIYVSYARINKVLTFAQYQQ